MMAVGVKGEYSMALPKAIQQQVEQYEQYEQSLSEQASDKGQTEDETQAVQDQPVEQQGADGQATPQRAEQQLAPDETRVWQERYHTLQSKYNAEVPRLHEQLRSASDQMQEIRRELDEVKARQSDESSQQQAATERDVETFGEDMVDFVRRIAREEGRRLLAEVDKRVAPLREQVGAVAENQAMNATERFWFELERQVPDWEGINSTSGWVAWLSEFDPVAGTTRQQALDTAQSKLDHRRVVGMFNAYKNATKPAETQKIQKPNLSRQVAPPKGRTSAPVPQGDRIWTQAEYIAAMDPRRQRELGGDGWAELMAQADQAFKEGRVR